MDSEKIATNHVELAISKAGHLVSHINSNDKEPSWDGDVEVYKKSGHVHAKADLILKVPVQVKGHIKPNLKKKSIKYSCWVFVKQFSRNDTATACQDWLRVPG